MSARYHKLGIQFLYPENWKLIDDVETAGSEGHVVSLESPDGSSTWSVHLYGRDIDQDDLLKETIAALEQNYEEVEISAIQPTIADQQYQGIEAMFYCLDFLVRAQLFFATTDGHTFLIWSQAEDRDFDQQAIVFKAIATSLLNPPD